MARIAKLTAAGFVLACLAFVAQSRAAIVTLPPPPLVVNNLYSSTLGAWNAIPSKQIQQQDKLWTFVSKSASLHNSVPVLFGFLPIDGQDNHFLTLADNNSGVTIPVGSYDLKYTIQVIPGGPGVSFASVSLGATLAGADAHATVVKTLTDFDGNLIDTLTSIDGSTASTTAVDGLTFLRVDELITVTHGAIFATTDTYTQNPVVPEPATIVIWSLLGAGSWLGMKVWRRRTGASEAMSSPLHSTARQSWSPEARQAIREIISRGAPR